MVVVVNEWWGGKGGGEFKIVFRVLGGWGDGDFIRILGRRGGLEGKMGG